MNFSKKLILEELQSDIFILQDLFLLFTNQSTTEYYIQSPTMNM